MVGPDGVLPLPWLAPLLRRTLATQHAHALLLHGPQGVGQFELALTLAQAWLCEAENEATRPCGTCAACRLTGAHSHPDLLVLMPPALQLALGWASADDDEAGAERGSKAKPSKEIKVDAVRAAVAFASTTSARGRAKVVVVHPAERMNAIAASALLKTLEEPPGATRFILACGTPEALLPTIRSRCQRVAMSLPPTDAAVHWLAGHGVADAAMLLAAAGGQPELAREWAEQGVDGAAWARLPGRVAQGDVWPLSAWPLPRAIDALQKLCHDVACTAAGARPRYFPASALRSGADTLALAAWARELQRAARHAEHPWNAGLMIEALVEHGRRALAGNVRKAATAPRDLSVHSEG